MFVSHVPQIVNHVQQMILRNVLIVQTIMLNTLPKLDIHLNVLPILVFKQELLILVVLVKNLPIFALLVILHVLLVYSLVRMAVWHALPPQLKCLLAIKSQVFVLLVVLLDNIEILWIFLIKFVSLVIIHVQLVKDQKCLIV